MEWELLSSVWGIYEKRNYYFYLRIFAMPSASVASILLARDVRSRHVRFSTRPGRCVSGNVRLIPLNTRILAGGPETLQRFPTYKNVTPVASRVGTNVHHVVSHKGGPGAAYGLWVRQPPVF